MTGPDGYFRFAGRDIGFRSGQTVGAALVAAGVRSWRTTRVEERPRGLFCGIGVCFDCLLVIDGRPNQRACLAPARQGLDVQPQKGTGRDHLAV